MKQTSLLAFQDLSPKILSDRYREIFGLLIHCKDGMTDYEIAKSLGQNDPNYVRPRRHELVEMGRVQELGKRQCTITGRKAIIWGVL